MKKLVCLIKDHKWLSSKTIDTEKYFAIIRTCSKCGVGQASPNGVKWYPLKALNDPFIKSVFEKEN